MSPKAAHQPSRCPDIQRRPRPLCLDVRKHRHVTEFKTRSRRAGAVESTLIVLLSSPMASLSRYPQKWGCTQKWSTLTPATATLGWSPRISSASQLTSLHYKPRLDSTTPCDSFQCKLDHGNPLPRRPVLSHQTWEEAAVLTRASLTPLPPLPVCAVPTTGDPRPALGHPSGREVLGLSAWCSFFPERPSPGFC